MKFTVSQSALEKALSVVSRGMSGNSTLPILSGVHITAQAGMLEFQTTNLDISIRHRIAANVEEEGEAVVSGRMLSSIVRTLPDAAVAFEGGGSRLSVKCNKSSFLLNVLDSADFPDFPEYDIQESVELPCELLSEMVAKVYKVASKDTNRPILTGILLTVDENTIRLVATDSYRLAICDSNTETSTLTRPFEAIVPALVFHDVLSLQSLSASVTIGTATGQIVFLSGDTTYVSRKIEGTFPNYRQILPKKFNTSVTLSPAALSSAMKRVSVVAQANASVRFDMDAQGDLIRLSASSPDQGESSETLDAEVSGESSSIALNHHYVSDCVNAIGAQDTMTLELQDGMQPAVFKSYAKINYLYLLMPVRM